MARVYDAGQAGTGALAASGGMLAAGFEASAEMAGVEGFAQMASRALGLWPDWLAGIERASGRKVAFERFGAITPAFAESDLSRLDRIKAAARHRAIAVERLDAGQTARAEPRLAPALASLVFPGDGQVDNRALGGALAAACRALGVEIVEHFNAVFFHPLAEDGVVGHTVFLRLQRLLEVILGRFTGAYGVITMRAGNQHQRTVVCKVLGHGD